MSTPKTYGTQFGGELADVVGEQLHEYLKHQDDDGRSGYDVWSNDEQKAFRTAALAELTKRMTA
tara:strand:+ start:205 stop:396 length:192 start_codon:yes stop_codon:yes gene_type:complete